MKRVAIGLVVVTLACCIACLNDDAKNAEWYPKSESLAIRFQGTQGGTRLQRFFQLPANAEFEAECTVQNCSPHAMDLCAVLFIDYHQVPFKWNSTAGEMTQVFSLDEGQQKTYLLRTGSLTEGYHEFLLVFFSHPFYHSTNKRWRTMAHMARWYWRANLYVGNAVLGSTDFPLYYDDTHCGCASLPVSTGADPMSPGRPLWIADEAWLGQHLNYFVTLSNAKGQETDFALIYLLDYRQIPAHHGSNELVTFGKLAGSGQVDLPASVQITQEGLHELIVLCVWRPYTELENPPGTLAYAGHVDSSNRTLIIAESTDRG